MRNFQRAFILRLAMIGGSVATCSLATGSSISFPEWHEDERFALLVLPARYEPAPVHVPHLTNPALMQSMGVMPEIIQPSPGLTLVRPAPEGTTNGPLSSPLLVPAPPSILLLLIGMAYLAKRLRTAARDKASHRKQRGGFIQADEVPLEAEPRIYPSPDESIDHLQYSGWLLGVRVFTDSKGQTVWQIDGSLGENRIQAEGATRAEAWHKAALAAAACGKLADRSRPASGA
jgi:hypothetical protein